MNIFFKQVTLVSGDSFWEGKIVFCFLALLKKSECFATFRRAYSKCFVRSSATSFRPSQCAINRFCTLSSNQRSTLIGRTSWIYRIDESSPGRRASFLSILFLAMDNSPTKDVTQSLGPHMLAWGLEHPQHFGSTLMGMVFHW